MDVSHAKILPYQPDWPKKFQAEKEKLQRIFSDKAIKIEHIGSIAIEGLSSKPIIDIAVMIKDHREVDLFTKPLLQMGYKFHSASTERYFYTKGVPIKYHLSIAYADRGGFWSRQILFRDYLKNHPGVRDEYAGLKEDLLQKYPSGSDEYMRGKTGFVQKVLKLAGLKEGQKYGG